MLDAGTRADAGLATFGLSAWRFDQREIIINALQGRSSVVMAPTGSGKTLCFALPAHVLHAERQATTVVISPLLALIREQVLKWQALKIPACALNSTTKPSVRGEILRALESADAKQARYALLYTTPETLQSQDVRKALAACNAQGRLALIAVDEAHCSKPSPPPPPPPTIMQFCGNLTLVPPL